MARRLLEKDMPASQQWLDDRMSGCPVHELRTRLREADLRPTLQRIALGWLLFGRGNRHVTAETLHEEATARRVPVSLATVYNTLRQFSEAGLLTEIGIDGSRTYFDTNTSRHHHFLLEDEQKLIDIPEGKIAVSGLPEAPEGMEVTRVDLVVRVRRRPA
jgi:Fur family transcriptional regulator, iron response regulator